MAQTVPLHYLKRKSFKLKNTIVTAHAPSKIILFGSYAKERIKKSDIDIARSWNMVDSLRYNDWLGKASVI